MKLLFAYATSSFTSLDLIRTLEWQQQWTMPDGERIAITDKKIEGLEMDQIVDEQLSGAGGYWRSLARNLAIAEALKRHADALVNLDSDGVFVAARDWNPSRDFEVCKGYMTEEFQSLPEVVKSLNDDERRWIDTSYWVIGSNLLKAPWFRSYLGFIGQGYEDFDFFHNVAVRHDVKPEISEARVIHLWHSPLRNLNQDAVDIEFLRNKRLYEMRKKAFSEHIGI